MDQVRREPGVFWLFFSPSGRISRVTFLKAWAFWLCLIVADIGGMFAHEHDSGLAFFTLIITMLSPLATLSILMLGWKRAHDFGAPGILALLLIIPAIGVIVLIALMAAPSQAGGNAYAAAPDRPAG